MEEVTASAPAGTLRDLEAMRCGIAAEREFLPFRDWQSRLSAPGCPTDFVPRDLVLHNKQQKFFLDQRKTPKVYEL
jgi:hypothetical protein